MENNTPKRKATKRLKNFDFSVEGAAVSLVGPDLGNAANGFKVLAIKAANTISQVAEQKNTEEAIEKSVEPQNESDEVAAKTTTESDASTNAGVEKSVGPTGSINQEVLENKPMTEPVVEMVEKSQFVELVKSLDDTKVELQKALDQIKQHEAEKKEAIVKAKTKEIAEIVKDEAKVAILAKAALSLEGDEFDAFKGALSAILASVETSEMFVEKGVTTSEEVPAVQESLVQKALKKQLAKTK